MLRVMIVDDEPYIRQGLKILIDWQQLGYEIASEAANGSEAVEILKKQTMDVILLDIKMPEMSGIELIEYVARHGLTKARIVLLSGYYEFDYAKKAIRYGVSEYILKPIQKDELEKCLIEIRSKIEASREESTNHARMAQSMYNQNLLSLIWDKYDPTALDYVQSKLGDIGRIRYVCFELDGGDPAFAALNDCDKRQVQLNLCTLLSKSEGMDPLLVIADVNDHEECYDVGMILPCRLAAGNGSRDYEVVGHMLAEVRPMLPFKIRSYIGQQVESMEDLAKSFQSAAIVKSLRTFRKNHEIAYYEEVMASQATGRTMKKDNIDKLIKMVEENDKVGMDLCVEAIYDELRQQEIDLHLFKIHMDYMLVCFINLATELDQDTNQEAILKHIGKGSFSQVWGNDSSSDFKRFVREVADYLESLRKKSYHSVLNQVDKEIEQHYMENLCLKLLGEKYFINSAYLGQIFKKKYGTSFKDYLNNFRIEKASEMLLRSDEKVYRIAELVGYNDLDYFISRFVSIKGKTPLQYRKGSRT